MVIKQVSKPSWQVMEFTGEQTVTQHDRSRPGNIGQTCPARTILPQPGRHDRNTGWNSDQHKPPLSFRIKKFFPNGPYWIRIFVMFTWSFFFFYQAFILIICPCKRSYWDEVRAKIFSSIFLKLCTLNNVFSQLIILIKIRYEYKWCDNNGRGVTSSKCSFFSCKNKNRPFQRRQAFSTVFSPFFKFRWLFS